MQTAVLLCVAACHGTPHMQPVLPKARNLHFGRHRNLAERESQLGPSRSLNADQGAWAIGQAWVSLGQRALKQLERRSSCHTIPHSLSRVCQGGRLDQQLHWERPFGSGGQPTPGLNTKRLAQGTSYYARAPVRYFVRGILLRTAVTHVAKQFMVISVLSIFLHWAPSFGFGVTCGLQA